MFEDETSVEFERCLNNTESVVDVFINAYSVSMSCLDGNTLPESKVRNFCWCPDKSHITFLIPLLNVYRGGCNLSQEEGISVRVVRWKGASRDLLHRLRMEDVMGLDKYEFMHPIFEMHNIYNTRNKFKQLLVMYIPHSGWWIYNQVEYMEYQGYIDSNMSVLLRFIKALQKSSAPRSRVLILVLRES